ALEVATNKYIEFEDKREAIEFGIRVGLAYLTLGIVSAPVEGFVGVRIKKRRDGKDYLACYFGGPIRGAGGTAAALTLLIADFLRRKFNLYPYDPDEREIQRYLIEVESYHVNVQRLQFFPTKEELTFLIEHIPIEITGDATTEREVLAYKDLERVETNKIRGGMCLVLCEGIAQKAKKILKYIKEWGDEFGLEDWKFLNEYLKIQQRAHTTREEKESGKVTPDYRYIEETVAGRPIFSHPMAPNGFRLRYGRSRLSGLAACSLNPATMYILDEFIATGSQLKLERPGKAAAVTPCDLIEGPVVRLKGGTVIRVNTEEEARRIKDKVEKVLFLGDILISYGDFVEQNHILLPSGWVEEWWVQELEKVLEEKGLNKEDFRDILENPFKEIEARKAIDISLKLGIPLHPRYTYHWNYLGVEDFKYLYSKLKGRKIEFPLVFEMDEKFKEILEKICIPHKVEKNSIIIEENEALPFLYSLGILPKFEEEKLKALEDFRDPLEFLNKVSVLKLRNKIPFTVGARLGRPEKAKMRRLKTRPHMLFPLGSQGGRMRSLNEALKKGYVEVEVPIFFCPKCNSKRMYRICRVCGSRTQPYRVCQNCGKYTRKKIHCGAKTKPFEKRKVDIKLLTSIATKGLGVKLPPLVKGVKGTSSKGKIAEPIEKGILRAKNRVYVNKDGTIRFDCIEVPITHFRPKEIGLSVEEVKALGYKYDVFGNEIESEDQLVELFPQDIILPDCKEWGEASAA
ncbi:MAG TPA: DNA polymerase II large subunit, partial [Candidatus Aenigmarchaeota archaeon]|nr:DNA polymerase II large subunit [Candidatus Aenigmarchaeota archaeon]